MIFKRPVLIPALLCSIGLIKNHGHNESDCSVGERKMDCKFFSRLIKDHLSLEPQGIALETTPEGGVLLGPERPSIYEDLSDTEKKRYDADDNVKMLLAGSEFTKEDIDSQLYDEFERFKMLPGENINEYYVSFHKLVNDIRNIRMTMPNIQLNSKFVNNMSPEWD
ncbi:hypothetical protein Tco_1342267, partial [Tanacetum coccineum]